MTDNSVDVVVYSLFLHHFEVSDDVIILGEAARVARRGIVVDDLSRSRLVWLVTWIVTRPFGRSRIFHVDGPRSVAAAFSKDEMIELARQAGLLDARAKCNSHFA